MPASRRVPRWRWKSHPPCWTNCLRDRREALRDVLALDPRPRYQQDPDRVYGFLFAGQEVRFTVDGDRLQVVDIK